MKTALDLRAIVALVVLCGSWGLTQVAIKVTLLGMPPALQLGARSVLAALLVFLWCLVRAQARCSSATGRSGRASPPASSSRRFLAIFCRACSSPPPRAPSSSSIWRLSWSRSAGISSWASRLARASLPGWSLPSPACSCAFSDALALPSRATCFFGDVLCVGAAVLWGLTTSGQGVGAAGVAAEKTLLYQLGVSAVLGLVLSLAIGDVEPGLARGAAGLPLPGDLGRGVTYIAWFALIRAYPASLLSSFTFLTPLFGVAFGAALLGEPVHDLIAALLLVAAGIYLVNRGAARPRQNELSNQGRRQRGPNPVAAARRLTVPVRQKRFYRRLKRRRRRAASLRLDGKRAMTPGGTRSPPLAGTLPTRSLRNGRRRASSSIPRPCRSPGLQIPLSTASRRAPPRCDRTCSPSPARTFSIIAPASRTGWSAIRNE